MKRLLLKICGLTDIENARALALLGVDYLGFIFVDSSSRNVRSLVKPDSISMLCKHAKPVAVVRDEPLERLIQLLSDYPFLAAQLHGAEAPSYCEVIRKRFPAMQLIKAFHVHDTFGFGLTNDYRGLVDLFVFDKASPKGGGSGEKFSWTKLAEYEGQIPFLLSGGVAPGDAALVSEAFERFSSMGGVDLNSRFEIRAGIKSVEQVKSFRERLPL